MKMMNRALGKSQTRVLKASHHLNADGAACRLKTDSTVGRSTDQPEVAVDVSHSQPKEKFHRPAVKFSDQLAVNRIGSADLVSIHPIYVVGDQRNQPLEL